MSEYRFTGPFYSDNDESLYSHDYENEQGMPVTPPRVEPTTPPEEEVEKPLEKPFTPPPVEPVTPPPSEPTGTKKENKKERSGKSFGKTVVAALVAGVVAGAAFLGVVYAGFNVFGIGKTEQTVAEIQKAQGIRLIRISCALE